MVTRIFARLFCKVMKWLSWMNSDTHPWILSVYNWSWICPILLWEDFRSQHFPIHDLYFTWCPAIHSLILETHFTFIPCFLSIICASHRESLYILATDGPDPWVIMLMSLEDNIITCLCLWQRENLAWATLLVLTYFLTFPIFFIIG